MLGKRVKSRLDKLDVLQKQFHQLKQRKHTDCRLDTNTMQSNRQHVLEESLSPFSTANEPHVYTHTSPSTDDETALHQILGHTHPLTDTSTLPQTISETTQRDNLYQQALNSFFSTLPDCHLASTSMATHLTALPPFAPAQLEPTEPVEIESQAAVYFSDPWISDAHDRNDTTIQLPAETRTIMDGAIVEAIEAQSRDTDASGKGPNRNMLEICNEKDISPPMDMELKAYPIGDPLHTDSTRNREVDLQKLGSLHVIMDTIHATAFTNFDELVVYYYTGELSRSVRLAHEQYISRSKRLSGVLRDLVNS